VHQALEPGQVDVQDVVDPDARERVDGLGDLLGAVVVDAAGERGVDLVVADAGAVHPQVAREREERRAPLAGVRVHQDDRVGAVRPADVLVGAELHLLLLREARAAVAAEQQVVAGGPRALARVHGRSRRSAPGGGRPVLDDPDLALGPVVGAHRDAGDDDDEQGQAGRDREERSPDVRVAPPGALRVRLGGHIVQEGTRRPGPGEEPPVTIVWRPTPEYVERANVTRLMRAHGIATYEELVRRSVEDVAWFWDAVVKDLDIEFLRPYESVLDTSKGVEWATWFGGGRVNLAHACVDRWAERTPDAVAVVWEGEEGEVRRLTYRELREAVDRLANGLVALGIGDGDAVGIFLPPSPEAVVAVMACSKLGAIWLPLFSGFAADAVAQRLNDAGAKLLITADGFLRRGRPVPMKEIADAAAAATPTLRHILVCNRLARTDAPWTPGRDVRWDELLAAHRSRFEAASLDPEHPLFLAYTSGT